MSAFMVVCPLCLTIYMMEYYVGDECPSCDMGELMSYDEYQLRLSGSFMNALEEERGGDD